MLEALAGGYGVKVTVPYTTNVNYVNVVFRLRTQCPRSERWILDHFELFAEGIDKYNVVVNDLQTDFRSVSRRFADVCTAYSIGPRSVQL